MPPSTDCSAATSCGGCRSYAGGVADGRLNSSATATGYLLFSPARPHHHSAQGKYASSAGVAVPNMCSVHAYRGGLTVPSRRWPRRMLGTRGGGVHHRCARRSAQLVDKSVDGGVSTCGGTGGHDRVR